MADIQARLEVASSFILQSPPGEVNDVFNDIRALVGDDDALESGILPALEQYNVEQLVVADLPDKQQLLVCSSGLVASHPGRYIEPSTGTSWAFDHLRLTASEPLPIHVDEATEPIRVAIEAAARAYAKEHFADGVSKVFTAEQTHVKQEKPQGGQSAVAATTAEVETVAVEAPMEADTPVAATDGAEAEPVSQVVDAPFAEVEEAEAAEEESVVPGESLEAEASTVEPAAEQVDAEMASADTPAPPVPAPEEAEPAPVVTPAAPEPEPEPIPPADKRFSLYFVGNKYNPSNYWTGRWRSSYALDLTSGTPTLQGQIQLNVHFFEQGNVQLSTSHAPEIQLPQSVTAESDPKDLAKAVLKAIGKVEEEYQLELNDTYRELSDKTFRSLRRALPVTRQKMDWAKVANYKIGRDLGGSRE